MTRIARTFAIATLALVALGAVATGRAADYRLTLVAETGTLFSNLGSPVINGEGVVAFAASLDTGAVGIFTSREGSIAAVATSDRGLHFFGLPPVAINGAGAVAFIGTHRDQGLGVFRAHRGQVETIASIGPVYSDFDGTPAIAGDGRVAFLAYLDEDGVEGVEASGIFLSNGAETVVIARHGDTNPEGMRPREELSINDEGMLAFLADTTAHCGPELWWCEPKPAVFTISAGHTAKVADTAGRFSWFMHAPAINRRGQIAFRAGLDQGGEGIFVAEGASIAPVADTSGPYESFMNPSIDDRGRVAFWAQLDDGGHGVFAGPAPTADKLVAEGDPVLGSKAELITLSRDWLNNRGQAAVLVRLTDGRAAILLADPANP